MKLGVPGQVTDIITCVKFLVNRFRGYGVMTPKIHISHLLAVSPLQQCTHCRATSWQETLLVRWSMAKEIKADEAAVCMVMKLGNERHNLRVGRVCWSQLFAECVWVIRRVVRFTIALLFMSFCPFCRAQSPWFFFLRTQFPDVGTLNFSQRNNARMSRLLWTFLEVPPKNEAQNYRILASFLTWENFRGSYLHINCITIPQYRISKQTKFALYSIQIWWVGLKDGRSLRFKAKFLTLLVKIPVCRRPLINMTLRDCG